MIVIPNESNENRRARYARNIELAEAISSLLLDDRFITWKNHIDKKIESTKKDLREAKMGSVEGRMLAEANTIRWQAFEEVLEWDMLIEAGAIARQQLKSLSKGAK